MNKYNADIANLDATIASLDDRINSTNNAKADVDARTADKAE